VTTLRRARLLWVAAVLSGCSLAPHYTVPETPAPPAYKEAGQWIPATPADAQPRGSWWQDFNDPVLNQLEGQLVSANQDLKAAVARFTQARLQVVIARSAYFPSVDFSADATRQRQSTHSPHYAPTLPQVYNDLNAGMLFSYELDVWGKVRNSVASAKALAEASAGDLSTLDLSLQAELASDYFALRGADEEIAILDATVADYQRALALTQRLFDGGAAAASDVDQQQTTLESAKAQAIDQRLQRAQYEHAIAVLIGQAPAQFSLPVGTLVAVPPVLDPGLPSSLLQRRPDIAAAERRVVSANALIGVARAAYYPDFTLNGSLGFEAARPSNWITAPSRFWSLGPQAALTVFDAGRIHALTDQARAAYDESVADYRQSVLTAFQEVEDSLVAMHLLNDELARQHAAVAAAQRALTQSLERYRGGVTTQLEVVTNENTALAARRQEVDLRVRRVTAGVMLLKALGGGWTHDALTYPPEARAAAER
jgi:NodT family efflux transporter outer membrane factor (OMF) lipoprotein